MAADVVDDLAYSEAFKIVNALAESGELTPEQADLNKRRFEELHGAVMRAMASEKRYLEDAKMLKRQIDAAQEAPPSRSDDDADLQAAVQVLKEDEEAAKAEAALAEEKEKLMQLELVELQRQRNEAMSQVEEIQEEHRQRLMPKINELQAEVNEVQDDIDVKDSKLSVLNGELTALNGKVQAVVDDKMQLAATIRDQDSEVKKAGIAVDKAARQVELVEVLKTQLEKQHGDTCAKLEASDAALVQHQLDIQNLEDLYASVVSESERMTDLAASRQENIDSLKTDLSMLQVESEKILAEQAEVAIQVKMKQTDLKRHQDALNHMTKDKERLLKKYKKMENVLKVVSATLPSLQIQNDLRAVELDNSKTSLKRQQEDIKKLKVDVDVHMSLYLTEEMDGKEKNTLFVLSQEHIMELESSIKDYRKAEMEHQRAVYAMSAARDKAARHASLQSKKLKEVKKETVLKEMVGKDLRKMRRSIVSRVKDFQQLYDMVKNQRNRFVNLIQTARQGIAEMKEKHKILTNELDILRVQSGQKDQQLTELRSKHAADVSVRNGQQVKLNKLRLTFKERVANVDKQIAEIDKLNAIINSTEKDMMKLKKQYEVIVELRNFTGIMLIDRNDELCVLYEKANIQEAVLKAGNAELTRLEDEARMLRIEITEMDQSIFATRKLVPKIPAMDHDVVSLQKEILLKRREAKELEQQLEDPGNTSRWRMLGGRIQDKDELRIKINQLEERLNDKKEQLLERELILDEVTTLSNTLRLQAASGRGDTLEVARKVNDYQNRTRAVTCKMMATISELSMYQATALKLAAEKDNVEAEVGEARRRLADGDAPTEEAQREWHSLLREKEVAANMRAARAEAQRILDAKGSAKNTTAAPRPHAYIPEKLGIPKPYGTFLPFKPSEASSTMRHIRKPEPREVVI